MDNYPFYELIATFVFVIAALISIIIGILRKTIVGWIIGIPILLALLLYTLIANPNMSIALSAFSTIALTIFASLTLFINLQLRKDAKDKEDRDRKERLLNEIIEWAIEVAKPKYALNLISVISSRSSIEDQSSALQISWASHIDTLIVRGDYIAKITLIFTKDLRIAVEEARNELKKQASYFCDLIHGKGSAEAIGKHNYELTQSAKKVIEEATKIKTRDIS